MLALASLFMVSTVMKKGAPPAVVTAAATSNAGGYVQSGPTTTPTTVLNALGDLAGEVGSAGNTLDGMELDEKTVQTQQMLEQVASLVKENPDSAAAMVKRWLNRA